MTNKSRRNFLHTSVNATVAGALSGRAVDAASANNVQGANDRIRLALIGCGGQGSSDLLKALQVPKVECVALCDVDDAQTAKQLKTVSERFGQTPALVTRDFRRVLDQKDIDAVIIATPDHWHAITTIQACQAGKDVYVEKPLATSIAEGRAMVEAARRYSRVVQVGTMLRSSAFHQEAMAYVQSGKLGKIRMVRGWAYLNWVKSLPVVPDEPAPASVDYDLWLGPAPKRPFNRNRFHFNFRWFWDYAGGLTTDWGAHQIDIASWGMQSGAPQNAMAAGGKFGYPDDAQEIPDTLQALWTYPGYTLVWEHAVYVGRGPEAREHGVAFHGNNGVLVIDRSGWEVFPETERGKDRKDFYRMVGEPRATPRNEDPGWEHARNFFDCMRSRKRPAADIEIGFNSILPPHLANIAFRTGRTVTWDGQRIVNDPEAQRLVAREYRAPWKLPT